MKLSRNVVAWVSVAVLASSLAMASSAGMAKDAPPSSISASPLLGSWSVDISRLSMPPEQRPKSVVFTFSDAGGGKWTTRVDIAYAAGVEVHSVSTASLDGSTAPIENSPEADVLALKQPAPNVLVMALKKGDVLASTRIYAVTPGGQTMVETEVYPGDGGVPVMRTHYFTRVR